MPGWDARVDHLEQEGEALLDVVTAAAGWAAELGGPVSRVIDVGSGPGVGTCELALRFPEADILAVDASEPMLTRVTARAESLGVSARVTTHLAEIPDGIGRLPAADLVYASMILHHAPDPEATLMALGGLLTRDGLLIVIEHGPGAIGEHVPVIDLSTALARTAYEVLGNRVHSGRQMVIARRQ
jgi:trans-aconitate methyltransferase